MQTSFDIDIVLAWCDGSDPEFSSRKSARLKEVAPPNVEENIGDVRYVQHDELRYCLRSIEKFTPWVRRIFLVTDNQRPAWLKDHPKVTVVDHKEIIPAHLLPIFSAIAIEMHIHKIPGLSEHFIYGNDDIFMNRPLQPSDFFADDGKPFVWVNRRKSKKTTPDAAREIIADESINNWHKTVLRAWNLHLLNGGALPFLIPAHSFDAYTKTLYRETLNKHSELLKANSSPFRTGDEISRCFFAYEMIAQYDCPPVFNERRRLWHKIFNTNRNAERVVIVRLSASDLIQQIRRYNPKTFCLQNLEGNEADQGITYLKQRFPDPAPWENTTVQNKFERLR